MTGPMKSTFRPAAGPTLRRLLDRLKITDREIRSRKELLFFTDTDAQLLAELQPIIRRHIDTIVESFYERQLRSREVALLIGDVDTLNRLSDAMRDYILELFGGTYDAAYFSSRLRIGKVHQRIGLPTKLYVSAMSLLQAILYDTIHPDFEAGQITEKHLQQRAAIRKLLLLDMELIFETYTASLASEVDAVRNDLESYIESLEDTVAERTEQLQALAVRDGLTGLFNRRGFLEHLRRELAVAERTKGMLSLIYFDLNNFKLVNDVKGTVAGDNLLTHVGATILATIRQVDFGCRYGGDEFCIILPRTDEAEAQIVLDRFCENYEKGEHMGVTISAGIVQTGPESYMHADALVQLAGARMNEAQAHAKQSGAYLGRTSSADRAASSGTVLQPADAIEAAAPAPELPPKRLHS